DDYYAKLQKLKLAYPCFCTEDQLALNRKIQRSAGQAPRYPGTCRHLSESEVRAKEEKGLKPTLRFHVPNGKTIQFQDLVRGQQTFMSDDIGDFIIRRADGTASFLYCNAIDDALMGVTHALRGEDHLTNTPRQLLIVEALNLQPPQYGHISLILGSDGSPLSKRNGSRSIKELREEGYLPLAVNNYLARLGHHYASDEFLPLEKLSEYFNADSLVKSAARFDVDQLNRWQKQAVMSLDNAAMKRWLADIDLEFVPREHTERFLEVARPNILFPKEAKRWAVAIFAPHIEYSHEGKTILKKAGINFFEKALEALNESGTDYKALVNHLKVKSELSGAALFHPLRVALTGETFGPELLHVLPLMGQALAKQRLESALYAV
ncbi:MAG: glutamate--tRNA ligase, partial [Proteobacteria bacterium]|nr:glutamate--tRNA ligase [Pseudomonadota bacterium]